MGTKQYTFNELTAKAIEIENLSVVAPNYATLIWVRQERPSGYVTIYQSPDYLLPNGAPSGIYFDDTITSVSIGLSDFAADPIDPATGLFYNCPHIFTFRTYPTDVPDPGHSEVREFVWYEGQRVDLEHVFNIICEDNSLFVKTIEGDYPFPVAQGVISSTELDNPESSFLYDGSVIGSDNELFYLMPNPYSDNGVEISAQSDVEVTYEITANVSEPELQDYSMLILLTVTTEKTTNCNCEEAICALRTKVKCAREKWQREAANKQQNFENYMFLSAVLTEMLANLTCNEGDCEALAEFTDCGCGCS